MALTAEQKHSLMAAAIRGTPLDQFYANRPDWNLTDRPEAEKVYGDMKAEKDAHPDRSFSVGNDW